MQRIARILDFYDRQGIHRTGTDADASSAHWLAREITTIGLEPKLEPFTLARIDVEAAAIAFDGRRIEGLPIFDGGETGAAPIAGRLGPVGSEAEIGVLGMPPRATPALREARLNAPHRAIVVATMGERPGLTPINADSFREPFGPPVLQISSSDWPEIEEAAQKSQEASVIVNITRTPATAYNVTARLEGRDAGRRPLVVMTPRSGWWRCVSERGGGIVGLLEIMRELRDSGNERDVLFTANSGHELGHLGLEAYLKRRPHLVRDAFSWIHLGANFAARLGSQLRVQASDEALQSLGLETFARFGLAPESLTPIGDRPRGEARNIFDGGGRYFSLLATNGLFHHPDDQWPDAVDLDRTVRIAAALSFISAELAGGGGD